MAVRPRVYNKVIPRVLGSVPSLTIMTGRPSGRGQEDLGQENRGEEDGGEEDGGEEDGGRVGTWNLELGGWRV
jgi:hypothetical protein